MAQRFAEALATLLVVLLSAAATYGAVALFAHLAGAGQLRSSSARAEFKRLHRCPATAATRGRCPGYVIDHVLALACGGTDAPANMQWQTLHEAKAKDRWETIGCKAFERPYP